VACTLVDVMTYVPIEQQTLSFGPRDYLNRFISLISTLRGGQSRYLPLLLNKIHDALPGYTPPETRVLPYGSGPQTSLRIEDIYEPGLKYESSASNPASHEATPYDSPPPVGQMPLRHGSAASSMHSGIQPYPEHLASNLASQQPQPGIGGTPFQGFNTTMGFGELRTVSTAPAPSGGLYQSHLPRQNQGFGE